jgi:predicted GNAT family N-acyltransferase
VIDEDAIQARMRELAARGDYVGALSEYATLEVHAEASPSAPTRRLLDQLRRFAPPPLGTGQMEVTELEGDHSEAERAELHDGEENAFESVHLGMYWEDHDRRIVIRDQGRMIACAGLIVAPVTVAERTFDVVGFGGVIVTRTRRGEGLARFVMEAAIARAAELGPDHALLFCRPDRAGLYAKLGFVELEEPVDVAQLDGERRTMPLATMWRPLHPGATWPSGPVTLPGLPF